MPRLTSQNSSTRPAKSWPLNARAIVRHKGGTTRIEAGDAFIFAPGEPHQIINDHGTDLVLYVIADNPLGESCYYPDSQKWAVYSPEKRYIRSQPLAYEDGEE